MLGDTLIKIQTEQCVQDVLYQDPVRLGSSKETAREKATAIPFSLLVLSNRAVDAFLMNRSLWKTIINLLFVFAFYCSSRSCFYAVRSRPENFSSGQ